MDFKWIQLYVKLVNPRFPLEVLNRQSSLYISSMETRVDSNTCNCTRKCGIVIKIGKKNKIFNLF